MHALSGGSRAAQHVTMSLPPLHALPIQGFWSYSPRKTIETIETIDTIDTIRDKLRSNEEINAINYFVELRRKRANEFEVVLQQSMEKGLSVDMITTLKYRRRLYKKGMKLGFRSSSWQKKEALAGLLTKDGNELDPYAVVRVFNAGKSTEKSMMNVFAACAKGMTQEYTNNAVESANKSLTPDQSSKFLFCANLKTEDEKAVEYRKLYDASKDQPSQLEVPARLQSSSMSVPHILMTTKNLRWDWHNVVSMGVEGKAKLQESVDMLKEMRAAATTFVNGSTEYNNGNDVSMCFHCYATNSIPSLHLHILNKKTTTHYYDIHNKSKNIEIDDVIKVLEEELKGMVAWWRR